MYYICDIMVAQDIKTHTDHKVMTSFFDVSLVFSCLIFGLVPLQSTAHTAFMCENVCVCAWECVCGCGYLCVCSFGISTERGWAL